VRADRRQQLRVFFPELGYRADAGFHSATRHTAPARVYCANRARAGVCDQNRYAVGRTYPTRDLRAAAGEHVALDPVYGRLLFCASEHVNRRAMYLRKKMHAFSSHTQRFARKCQVLRNVRRGVAHAHRKVEAGVRTFGHPAPAREEGMSKARISEQAALQKLGRHAGSVAIPPRAGELWYPWRPVRPKDPFIGREILGGQFQVLEKIGTGGMGSVYKASQPAVNRMVAIKILHPKLAGRKDLTSRFRREARAMSQLTHPNTVKVFMYGELEDDGSLYIVMEMLEGKNLNQTVRKEGPLPPERAIPVLIQVCGALQEAHDLGIVHRDLKPENIFLSRQGGIADYPKVLDFGLAKVTERQMQPDSVILTQEGMVFGTPEFMSPEQAQGKTLDARSDIYSLAVILYEVLTGKLPFSARTPMEYIQKHVMEPAIPLNQRVPERKFAPGLEQALARALAKKPDERYQSAAEFGEALRPFGGAAAQALPPIRIMGPQIVVERPGFPPSMSTAPGASSGLGLLVGVAVACLLGGVVIAIFVMRAFGK
jgi:tRNA A-37 threonylcarbamoyl transferase component Bud32